MYLFAPVVSHNEISGLITCGRRECLPFVLLICLGSGYALPQATAQATGSLTPQPTATQASAASASALPVNNNGPSENRKVLEARAGKNPAKLMLRSVPDGSSVLIDAKLVGKTPLLLIVKPGVYLVEMEGGPGRGYGRRQVDLLPAETREVVLKLQPRYPAHIRLSWGPRR